MQEFQRPVGAGRPIAGECEYRDLSGGSAWFDWECRNNDASTRRDRAYGPHFSANV